MRFANIPVSIVTLAVLLIGGGAYSQHSDPTGLAAMTRYLDLLASGNFQTAEDMWTPESLERSQRFDITYTGIPLKVDCSSPVVQDLNLLLTQAQQPIRNYKSLEDRNWIWLEYSHKTGIRPVEHIYYAEKRGNWYWLGFPQDYFCDGWAIRESRYFRVHLHPVAERFANDVVLSHADRFVESLADTLGIPNSVLQGMEKSKIEYFFCNSDSLIAQITGKLGRGIVDLPSNDIITTTLPHFHEMVHLLVNIRLHELPLFTLPIMREGMAVRFGGRWGKNTAALTDLAVFLYREELIVLDSILTMKGFESESGADIVYPAAGVFCSFLVDRLGVQRCLELYLALSGTSAELEAMTPAEIQAVITGATGHDDWAALAADFDDYLDNRITEHAAAMPGSFDRGRTVLEGEDFVVKEKGNWLAFEFVANDSNPDSLLRGNLLFGRPEGLLGQSSALFFEHYRDSVAYLGYRFGVRFDQNEAGLYDYATNQLLAKYIWGLTPSDDYYDADQQKISFRFRKSLLDRQLPSGDAYRLLPH